MMILGCFSNRSNDQLLISDERLYSSSQLKFDGECEISIAKNISKFLEFCEFYEMDYEDVSLILFFLTLEGWVNRWCHILPSTSIHSFDQFLKELHQAFDRYDDWVVYKIINKLRMNPDESIEDFSNIFLHLCYEFLEGDMNWYLLKQKFENLVQISLHGEF